MVQIFAASSFGLMIGSAVPNVQVGQIVAPLFLVILLIFGGLFVNLDKVYATKAGSSSISMDTMDFFHFVLQQGAHPKRV
jgi:ABC-2 type transporter